MTLEISIVLCKRRREIRKRERERDRNLSRRLDSSLMGGIARWKCAIVPARRGPSRSFGPVRGYRNASGSSQRASSEKRSKGNERVLETSLVIGNTTWLECRLPYAALQSRALCPLWWKTPFNIPMISYALLTHAFFFFLLLSLTAFEFRLCLSPNVRRRNSVLQKTIYDGNYRKFVRDVILVFLDALFAKMVSSEMMEKQVCDRLRTTVSWNRNGVAMGGDFELCWRDYYFLLAGERRRTRFVKTNSTKMTKWFP